jgi:bacterioferritin-associated ferredoxin
LLGNEKDPKFVYEKYVSIARECVAKKKKQRQQKLGQTADCGACLGRAQMMKRKIYKTMYTPTQL